MASLAVRKTKAGTVSPGCGVARAPAPGVLAGDAVPPGGAYLCHGQERETPPKLAFDRGPFWWFWQKNGGVSVPGLLGGFFLSTRETRLFPLKGHLCLRSIGARDATGMRRTIQLVVTSCEIKLFFH